jgi:hypothetical protein
VDSDTLGQLYSVEPDEFVAERKRLEMTLGALRRHDSDLLISVWTGIENGIAGADVSPEELAPTSQQQLHWPKFGQFHETGGKSGEAPDIAEVKALERLYRVWEEAKTRTEREDMKLFALRIEISQTDEIKMMKPKLKPSVVTPAQKTLRPRLNFRRCPLRRSVLRPISSAVPAFLNTSDSGLVGFAGFSVRGGVARS